MSARVSHGFLMAGLAAAAVCLWPLPWPLIPLLQALACLAAAGAVIAGIRRHAPDDPPAWRAVAGYLAAFGVGYLCFAAATAPSPGDLAPYPVATDLAFLAGYALLAAALLRLARGRRTLETAVDLAIVAVATTMVVVVFLFEPVIARTAGQPTARLLAVIYPVANVVIAAALVRFVLAGGARTRSGLLLAAGAAALVAADVLFEIQRLGAGYRPGGPADALWVAAAVLAGVAALHPSMRDLAKAPDGVRARAGLPRALLLGAAALIGPALLAAEHGNRVQDSGMALEIGTALVTVLVVARLVGLAKAADEATAASRRDERRLLTALDAGGLATWDWDAASNVYRRSPGMAALYGLPAGEDDRTDETPYRRVILPEDLPLMADWDRRLETADGPQEVECRVRRPDDGRIVWLRERATATRDAAGRIVSMQGITLDITARKLAEAALAESESLFRSTFENTALGMAIVGPDRTILDVNPAICAMLGYEPDELRAITFRDLVHPDAVDETAVLFARLVAGEIDSYRQEKRYLRKDGSVLWGSLAVSAVRDADGRFVRAISQLEDVTARKQAELALAESEALLRSTFADSAIGMAITVPPDGRLVEANPALCEMLGHAPGEMEGLPFASLTHPDDIAAEQELVREMLAGERDSYRLEKRHLHKNGSPVWTRTTVSCVRAPDGTVERFLGQVEEIGAERAAKAAIAESEARFRGLYEQSGIGMAVVGTDGRILDVNPAGEAILGYGPGELVGKTFAELSHSGELESDLALLGELLEGRRDSYTIEKRFYRKDGSVGWGLITVSVVRGADGAPRYVLSQLQDITARKDAEAALATSEARYRGLVANLPAAVFLSRSAEDHAIVFASAGLTAMLGYPPEAVTDNPTFFFDNIHPDDAAAKEGISGALRSGEPWSGEYRFRAADGRWRWVRNELALIRDPAGRPSHFQGVLIDIQAEKAAAAALAESEARFRSSFEDAAIGMAIVSPDARIIDANPAFCAMLGYEREAMRGLTYEDLSEPGFVEAQRELQDRLASGEVDGYRLEKRYRRKDGSTVWGSLNIASVRDATGRPVRMIAQVEDISGRKAAEEALALAEERNRLALEATGMAAWEYDVAADRITRSPGMAALYGLEAAPGDGYDAYVGLALPEDWPTVMAWRERLRREPGTHEVEYRIALPDGGVRWLREIGAAFAGEDGRVATMRGITQDVTAQRQSEEALRDSESRLRALIDQLPSIVYTVPDDDSDPSRYVSPSVERQFGLLPDVYIATWEERLHPEDREAVLAEVRRTDATGEPFRMEYRERAANGSYRWMRDDAVLVRDEHRGRSYWLGVKSDFSDMVAAQLAVQEADIRYRALVEGLPAMVYLADPADITQPIYVSPQVTALTGYAPEEWTGALWKSRVHPEDQETAEESEARGNRTGRSTSVEYRLVRRDGRTIWVRDSAELVRDPDGSPRYWQGFLQDITFEIERETSLREAKEAAEEASRLKSAFLSTISHELRTPMNGIIGYAGLLLEGMSGPLGEQQRADVRQIAASGEHLLALINDLLDLSRIEAGQMEIDLQPVDAAAALEEVRTQLAPLALDRGLALEVHADPGLPPLLADPWRLRQMLVNLAGNAIKFTDAGRVELAARHEGGRIALTVRDTGIGMDAETVSRLFDPFWQADARPNRRYGGAGLGLAITRRLAELQHGEIAVESEPGIGSAFTIHLPAAG